MNLNDLVKMEKMKVCLEPEFLRGYNQVIDDLSKMRLVIDQDKLFKIIYRLSGGYAIKAGGESPEQYAACKDLAGQISNNLPSILRVEKEGI